VWLALDEQTGLDVALKIIPREGKGAARAEREALAARRLRHDRCVRAYDVGHDRSHVYIAYEYIPGRTIREALESGALNDRKVVEVAAQILDALAHAHRAGIVHRDVKPSNVLLENRDGVAVRLLDFGLAQFDGADTLTAVGDVPGTLAYIAPERLAGADASAASDVWAVGVFLWEALAGRHPFWGMPLQQVAKAIEAGAPPLEQERPDLPRRVVTAIERALAPDPASRPRASELAVELRNALRPVERKLPAQPPRAVPKARVLVPPAELADRVAASALAAVTAALAATLLPFWPASLAAAIAVAAAVAGLFRPRLALAIALGAAVFPLGNEARGAAVLYGMLAIAWLALTWRDPRRGLLFVCGPLLAPVGALALAPLVAQVTRGPVRRGLQASAAVLAAAFVAATSGGSIPFARGHAAELHVTPAYSPGQVATALETTLTGLPFLVLACVLAGAAAIALPYARTRSRFALAGIGGFISLAFVAAGAPLGFAPLVLIAWGVAAIVAARAPS
jgi:eukaryotic-like serine/threonine-protein kinase